MTEISNAQLLELAQLSNFSYNDIFVQNEFNQLDLPYQHISTSTPRYFDVPVYNYDSGTTDYVTTTDGYTGHAFLNTQTNTLVIANQGSQGNLIGRAIWGPMVWCVTEPTIPNLHLRMLLLHR